MQAQAHLPNLSVEKIVERILVLRQITRVDQYLLMSAALAKDSISEKDQNQINLVFERLQRGLIKVVD